MKILPRLALTAAFLVPPSFPGRAGEDLGNGGRLEHEADLAKEQTGIHGGVGKTTGHLFFQDNRDVPFDFRKRVLHPGATIGYEKFAPYEIYYIQSGTGIMKVDDKEFPVKAGDAVLMGRGSWHGLRQTGSDDLVILIVFERLKPAP